MAFQDPASLGKKDLQDKIMKDLPWGGIWLADRQGQLIDASEWFLQLLGLKAEHASGFGWIERMARDDTDVARRWPTKLRSQHDWEDEVRIRDPSGRSHTLLTRAHLVRGSGDELEYWIGMFLDISRRADARRLQISRAKRQGRLVERENIARAIHSDIQQLLYATKTHIAALRRAASLEQAMATSESIQTLIDETIRVSRQLTRDLGPSPKVGLAPALEWLSEWMNDKHDLRVGIHAGETRDVTPEIQDLVFDVCRELLFNVVKHADVDSASIDVAMQEGQIQLTVQDQGRGFEPDQLVAGARQGATGFGLDDIRSRILAFGGDLEIESAPGRGTTVRAWVPYAN